MVYLDADLYSSTRFALESLRGSILAGDVLVFGQLHQKHHELKALTELLDTGAIRLAPLAATLGLRIVAFECVGGAES